MADMQNNFYLIAEYFGFIKYISNKVDYVNQSRVKTVLLGLYK